MDRDDAVRTVCFATGVLAGRVFFTARFAGLSVALFALWAAHAMPLDLAGARCNTC